MRYVLRVTLAALVAALMSAAAPPLVGAASAAGGVPGTPTEDQCAKPGDVIRPVPWSQLVLDPERAWPFSDGRGVTVAVLSSGVDAAAPQLAGHVLAGKAFLTGNQVGPPTTDCTGLGTQVAGVIAAQDLDGVGFRGFAPGAQIVPVTVAQADQVGTGDQTSVDLGAFAAAIQWATARHVGVLALPAVAYRDDPRVRAAVRAALAANVVVVASAGTTGSADQGARTAYPAAYDGVLGVGAVAPDGSLWTGSPSGDDVDLVAPGAQLVSTQRRRGLVPVEGTGIATGFVAAAAALVRSRFPALTAPQIVQRLEATATPAPGGRDSLQYGFGMPNPYQAVTDRTVSAPAASMPSFAGNTPDPGARARQAEWATTSWRAMVALLIGALVVAVVAIVAVAVPRGRRSRWHPVIATPPREEPQADLPSPPVQLFEDA